MIDVDFGTSLGPQNSAIAGQYDWWLLLLCIVSRPKTDSDHFQRPNSVVPDQDIHQVGVSCFSDLIQLDLNCVLMAIRSAYSHLQKGNPK